MQQKCKQHPQYKAIFKPRETTKHPNGCETCLKIWYSKQDKPLTGREASVLAFLAQSKGLSMADKARILATLEGQALKIAQVIVGQAKHPTKSVIEVAQGFTSWATSLGPVKKSRKVVAKHKNVDTFDKFWQQQFDFMKLLQEERNFPEFPVDITTKDGQKLIKDVTHDCMHELFESIHALKNSKNHRKTEVKEFDRENFIEELVDTMKFFLEILILAGISKEEFIDSFDQKTNVNIERIKGNY